MTQNPDNPTPLTPVSACGTKLETLSPILIDVGEQAARYGLVLVLFWIGGMKFTAYEAEGISGFVSNSPLMSWAYTMMSVQAFSNLLGVVEILTGVLIAIGPWRPGAGVVGALLAVGTFLTTLTFLITTPGAFEPSLGGFPALSVVPGQFVVKDFISIGVSIWLLGKSLGRIRTANPHRPRAFAGGEPRV